MAKPSPWGKEETGQEEELLKKKAIDLGEDYRVETPKDVDRKYMIDLTEQALEGLKTAWHMNDFDAVLWRLVDAAGLCARYANKIAVGQATNWTNRGYFVDQHVGMREVEP